MAHPPRRSPAEQLIDRTEREFGFVDTRVPLARRLSVVALVRAVVRDVGPHHLAAFAGNLAYNAFLAVVPFLLFLLLVLRGVHAADWLGSLVDVLSASLPSSAADLLRGQVQAEVASRVPDMWLLSALLAAGSLWACSAAFRAVATAMNVLYDTRDDRPWWVQLAQSIGLSLGTAAVFLGGFVLVEATSHSLAAAVDAPFFVIWTAVKSLVIVVAAFVGFAATCAFAPHVRRPIRAIVPGAVFATLVWVAFSVGYALVFNSLEQFLVDPLYGWFTGLFALLVYLYWSSFILLLGAEVNHAIEAHS